VDLRQGEITDYDGAFDLVMFNHSLEHVHDPLAALRHAASVLRPDGRVLVRIPVADSDNAERYGPNWFALDAPRHLWLPTFDGLAALSRQAGLAITSRSDDSPGTNEAWSRLYERGHSQIGPAGRSRDLATYFSSAELEQFDQRALDANARGRGDTTRVVLQPTTACG
jgi:SAM-dependent methyltransferase